MATKIRVNRLTLLQSICSHIGISKRAKPDSLYFSKRELLRLSSYIELAEQKLDEAEKESKEKNDD